jgi:DNA topoisomerase-2
MDHQPLEKIYQKKTQLEHILLRPDSYIGSTECRQEQIWVLADEKTIESRRIEYCPGLYKIFDEILVNAADNYQRDRRMSRIEVDIERDGNIRILNDGKSIPVAIHNEHKVYVAEMIFGHLLTSSNYEDNVKKIVGGRNGYGAKLANIFSKKFEVKTGDASSRKQLFISWSNNMSKMVGPEISPYSGSDYTSVSFFPDYKRFGMDGLT